MKIKKDKTFFNKKQVVSSSINYLNAIKQLLTEEEALKVAELAAANFMTDHYKKVLKGTKPGSQERFDVFRKHYEVYPEVCTYCEIITSNENSLEVKFKRCPYAEILLDEDLFEFAVASCLSDEAFTMELLPGIDFSRESSIVDGASECIMKWSKRL